MNRLLIWLGLAPSEEDKKLIALINDSYDSLRVVGRGTITIDPHEVRNDPQFKAQLKLAAEIVKESRACSSIG